MFPGMPMPLHIFEERYKQMINECVEAKRPFGIVCIEAGEAEYDTDVQPYSVGCTVDIVQVQKLEDGRFFIMTIGQERFRIARLKHTAKPYLVGDVTTLSYREESQNVLAQAANRLGSLLREYLSILVAAGKAEVDLEQLPQDPESLAGTAASLLDISLERKQRLLETNSLSKMIKHLIALFEREVKLLQMMPQDDSERFSLN
ncbi:MAG: LON peptidase substrate-binding domain-containing protein [Anaerolineales bacterium]|nr:LON peptidase substrate-binding domain-containing protein [Anaerolineales bacterium]